MSREEPIKFECNLGEYTYYLQQQENFPNLILLVR